MDSGHPKYTKQTGRTGNRGFSMGHPYFRAKPLQFEPEAYPPAEYNVRLTEDMYAKVAKRAPDGTLSVPDTEGRPGSSRLLRPKPEPMDISTAYTEGAEDGPGEMRLINIGKSTDMWNTCVNQHQRFNCDRPHFSVYKEVKWGLGWKQAMRCNNCQYRSELFKLYTEVHKQGPGPKPASCNVGLQVGLQDSPIGNTRLRSILASTNTPPPCRNAMQKMSNTVGAVTATVATDDMADRREEMAEINELRGLPPRAPINISMDVRYNSNTITSRNKMGQNASQAIGVAVEKHTDEQQIVGLFVENKLCWVGSWLRNRGFNVTCPGHANCTATMADTDPISERHIGGQIGRDIVNDGLLIQYVTTDGDARAAEGVQDALNALHYSWEVQRQADTTHLAQSQYRQALNATFSGTMFPGETAEQRKEQQKIFGLDIKNRCHTIFSTMYKKYVGDINKIAQQMSKVIEATLDCYSGDHDKCRYHSVVCGAGKHNNWWRKSLYLNTYGLSEVNISAEDRELLRALLLLRLGVKSLELTRTNANTNKNEAINRGISTSLPKNVNYSRNAKARACSAIHRLNLGAGNSMIRKLEAVGSPISKGRQVARAVHQMQVESRYHKQYTKRKHFKQQTIRRKVRHIKEFYAAKRLRKTQPEYKKGQLDPTLDSQ